MTTAPTVQTTVCRSPIIEKLALYAELDDNEITSITNVLQQPRSIRRGRDVVVQSGLPRTPRLKCR
jgi:pyrimidine operon attenuation protein/uracil phosphoribosyltransferase